MRVRLRLRRAQALACAAVIAVASIASAAETTLLDAVERGDRAAVVRLLAKGANPNTPGADGTTAIMWAASNNDLELVRALQRPSLIRELLVAEQHLCFRQAREVLEK